MSGVWGKNVKYSIFGESHGKGIGIVIDGLPAGISIDFDYVAFEMNRRRPGKDKFSTTRKERDQVKIISGYFKNKTTGTPLCAVIFNDDQKSKDYEKIKTIMRPGHADYTGYIKYKGANDYRGGGYFSGRLTAPLVFAGTIAKQILNKEGIQIGSHILQIGDIQDTAFDKINIDEKLIQEVSRKDFAVINDQKGLAMQECILSIKEENDSIGGIIEACAINLPVGLGEPFFDSVESILAHILFSIPAVKGVEFGTGFDIIKKRGSNANDVFYIDNKSIKTRTNHNGGILGGITNGMPLICRVGFKPTPSIGQLQQTIDIKSKENKEIKIEGRHDPCIVPRAIPVVEAAIAIGILELLFQNKN